MTYPIVLAVALLALAVFVRWVEPRLAFFPSPGETETPRDAGLAFEALTIETKDGERVHAWLIPAGTPRARVLYFHGNGGNLSNWSPILAGIVKHGYSVLAVDYRGYGLSTGRPTEQGLYRDVDALVARAWPGADNTVPLIFWGRSLGGAMAAYAATVRKPDGLIIEAGFPDARAVVRGSPVLAVLSVFSSYRFAAAEFINTANVPVLQLHGDHDSVIPFELGRELSQRIQGRKEFVTIAGGDHNDTEPTDPQAYWTAIDRFVVALNDQRSPRTR